MKQSKSTCKNGNGSKYKVEGKTAPWCDKNGFKWF